MRTEPLPIVGVELGARMENTALSVTERAHVPTGELFNATRYDHRAGRQRLESREKVTIEYRVRHLERRSPPVRYKGVAERVAELVGVVGDCVVAMDLTRTGRPVHSLIMKAIHEATKDAGVSVKHCPLTVTGEFGAVSHSPDVGWLVPRRDLVSSALLLFEQEQLKIAEGLDLARTLTREFEAFRPKAPKEELEGWRLAPNDDLVLAVAMSVWAAERFLRKEDSVPTGALGAA
ncbi:MAG: hypothetical protein WKF67_15100 [Rubrobacteraceae bacterium]